jgi:hypothetical protein
MHNLLHNVEMDQHLEQQDVEIMQEHNVKEDAHHLHHLNLQIHATVEQLQLQDVEMDQHQEQQDAEIMQEHNVKQDAEESYHHQLTTVIVEQ